MCNGSISLATYMPYSKKSPRQQDLPKIGNLSSIAPLTPYGRKSYRSNNAEDSKFTRAEIWGIRFLLDASSQLLVGGMQRKLFIHLKSPDTSSYCQHYVSHLHYLYSHSMILIIVLLIKICNPVDACLGIPIISLSSA